MRILHLNLRGRYRIAPIYYIECLQPGASNPLHWRFVPIHLFPKEVYAAAQVPEKINPPRSKKSYWASQSRAASSLLNERISPAGCNANSNKNNLVNGHLFSPLHVTVFNFFRMYNVSSSKSRLKNHSIVTKGGRIFYF